MTTEQYISFFEAASKVLKALGHPERLRIIELLREGEKSVGQIQRALDLSQPITSQHLRYMQRHNILASRREGTRFYYFLASKLIHKLLDCMSSCQADILQGEMTMKDVFPTTRGRVQHDRLSS